MRSRKTEIYGGLRGCIQKVIHFMHKVIPRYPVESPVDKVDSQFLRQVLQRYPAEGEWQPIFGSVVRRTHDGGHKGGHQGFHPCESRFLYFLVWRRPETGDRFENGERQRIFSSVGAHRVRPLLNLYAMPDTLLLHISATLRKRDTR